MPWKIGAGMKSPVFYVLVRVEAGLTRLNKGPDTEGRNP